MTRAFALVCSVVALLAGCGEEERTLDASDLEPSLKSSMNTGLDGLRISRVDCVFLSPELTRCFAEGTADERSFRLPVSVERGAGMIWSVTEEDLAHVRRGTDPARLAPGVVTVVPGPEGERVEVRVSAPIHPFDVVYPDVPPKYGNRYVALPVELRNQGADLYSDSPYANISGRLSDGSLVTPTSLEEGQCAAEKLDSIRLEPGERARGCAVFEVRDGLQLTDVALQLGYSGDILEWGSSAS